MKYLITAFVIVFLFIIYSTTQTQYPIIEISKTQMESMCDEEYECYGYATWGETEEGKYCTIFMLPMSYYPNDGDYEYVLEHEKRHCREGAFH
jgi:hypothetical protein